MRAGDALCLTTVATAPVHKTRKNANNLSGRLCGQLRHISARPPTVVARYVWAPNTTGAFFSQLAFVAGSLPELRTRAAGLLLPRGRQFCFRSRSLHVVINVCPRRPRETFCSRRLKASVPDEANSKTNRTAVTTAAVRERSGDVLEKGPEGKGGPFQ